ncbi:DUF2849 domain-containing protein [Qipengyuania sp. MTN3-11]|uniref:DUF2849 domain-containing protein n=1 Tax=Qipengyuania sp. MTN3-11 TaxID=3056557 RepID=UPI0036F34EFD
MEKSSKLPKLPVVLTANLLRGGEVVYFDGEGWGANLASAFLAEDEPAARHLETIAADSAGIVVDPYLVTAAKGEDGRPAPAHYREAIRAAGPTIGFGETA